MGLKLVTAAATEPITLAQLKAQCRVDTTDDDAVLTLAIAAARAKAENYTGAAIISQIWEQTLDAFPEAEIELLKPPVTGITSVSYVDTTGATQTITSSNYTLEQNQTGGVTGFLLPAYGYSWPDTRDQANAVTIRYTAGYADATAVPGDMRAWLLMTAAFIYAQREVMVLGGKVAEIPSRFCDSLLDPYRVFKV